MLAAFFVSAGFLIGAPAHSVSPAVLESTHPQMTVAAAALVAEGEVALVAGEPARATQLFEQAANLEHASPIELGLVRSYLQAGEYQRALAFAAHTAGAHREDIGGSVLYAWLLRMGGQAAYADRTLDAAGRRQPGESLLIETRQQLASPQPVPGRSLLAAPHRVAPYASGVVPPKAAQVVASGLLIDGGRHALVPLAAVVPGPGSGHGADTGPALWLRNGLGVTAAVTRLKVFDSLGLALLRVEPPLPMPVEFDLPPRDTFPGAPVTVVQYARSPPRSPSLTPGRSARTEAATSAAALAPKEVDGVASGAEPAWPWLHAGFLGRPQAATDDGIAGPLRKLGIAVPDNGGGGPVFDRSGRLVGVALPGTDGPARMVPVTSLISVFGSDFQQALKQALKQAPKPASAQAMEPVMEPAGAHDHVDASTANAAGSNPPDRPEAKSATRSVADIYERAMPVTLQVLQSP